MLSYTLIGLGFYIAISFAIRHARDFSIITSAWQHIFESLQFSSKEFYTKLEQSIKEKEIRDVRITMEKFEQTYAFSKERIYLRVRRGDWMFLICAAPFAKDFFVSYRSGAAKDWLRDIILSIPIIGFLGAKLVYRRTYFSEDADGMFIETVKGCIKEVINEMTDSKGVRALTEYEQQAFLAGNAQNLIN